MIKLAIIETRQWILQQFLVVKLQYQTYNVTVIIVSSIFVVL